MLRKKRLCRLAIKDIYNVPFSVVRPDWLRNPNTGYNLELDCYNDDVKIAIECYNESHYKWPNFTHGTFDDVITQINIDKMRMAMCKQEGVRLIVVSYTIEVEDIKDFILAACI